MIAAFSDVSFCDNTKAAGWAGWIKSDRGRVSKGGVIRAGVLNAGEAEFCALANRLAVGEQRGVLQANDWAVVQTDNLRVQSVLSGAAQFCLTPREREVVTWVEDLVIRLSHALPIP